ncbi:hypothetical protein NBRC116494_37810 [Aurantivibrio plasticivorans]
MPANTVDAESELAPIKIDRGPRNTNKIASKPVRSANPKPWAEILSSTNGIELITPITSKIVTLNVKLFFIA